MAEKGKILGHTHFDTPGLDNYISEVLVPQNRVNDVFRNRYVKINADNGVTFLGRIIEGPFYIPEEVNRGSAFAQTSILKGTEFPAVPNYYALARVELLGKYVGGKLFSTNTRPTPKSPVIELATDEVQRLIGLKGDMLVGRHVGYEAVKILMDSTVKNVLPRNMGIFGTVGSGKTNTAQVIIEEASEGGYAVVVVDVEGEYISMDKPTDILKDKLSEFGLKPEGLKNFNVYVPIAGETKRKKAISFHIKFSSMDPYILAEILQFTEAQERVFHKLIGRLQTKRKGKEEVEEEEEDETLAFLTGTLRKRKGEYTIVSAIKTIYGMGKELKGGEKISSYTLSSKLAGLRRQNIFDQPDTSELQVKSLLRKGRVSVIDVSGCTVEVKNIVIAWLLDKIFDRKMADPEGTPKTLVLIEEAHTFVSRENVDRMRATLDRLRMIARRGRKRWLCLGFISQQPAHLPSEIFELCNTRIIHVIKSERNINALKATGGDIVEKLWNQVPGLGVGEALISSPQYTHSIVVDVRPCKCKRELFA